MRYLRWSFWSVVYLFRRRPPTLMEFLVKAKAK